jgi:hypothetical protein
VDLPIMLALIVDDDAVDHEVRMLIGLDEPLGFRETRHRVHIEHPVDDIDRKAALRWGFVGAYEEAESGLGGHVHQPPR